MRRSLIYSLIFALVIFTGINIFTNLNRIAPTQATSSQPSATPALAAPAPTSTATSTGN